MVSFTLRPIYLREAPLFVDYEAGWPSEPVGTVRAGRNSVRLSEIEPRFLGLAEGRILFRVKAGDTVHGVATGLEVKFVNWVLHTVHMRWFRSTILIRLDTLEIN